jgi:hypothetical protein
MSLASVPSRRKSLRSGVMVALGAQGCDGCNARAAWNLIVAAHAAW